jgi:leucyl aminopeptidase
MKLSFQSINTYNNGNHDKTSVHLIILDGKEAYKRFLSKAPKLRHDKLLINKFLESYVVRDGNKEIITIVLENPLNIKDVISYIKNTTVNTHSLYLIMRYAGKFRCALLYAISRHEYTFVKYKTNTRTTNKDGYPYIVVDSRKTQDFYQDLTSRIGVSYIANDIANEPANKLYPQAMCDRIKKIFKNNKQCVKIICLDAKEMRQHNLNLVHGVGISAKHEPRFVVIELKSPNSNADPNICLLGKGVIFDAGGYDIKPTQSMHHMKGDKTGASVVIGIIKYMVKFHKSLSHNIIGILPLVENLVSGSAIKPGDVITAYNGKTVEVLNTDAEGRLILADALAYACKNYKPAYILDFATLTGWSQLMHCDTSFVYFTLSKELSHHVQLHAEQVGEKYVRMPAWPEYIRYTKGRVADVKNAYFDCTKSEGFMAAMFMLNFIENEYWNKWVHFDITHIEENGILSSNSIATGISLVSQLATSQPLP